MRYSSHLEIDLNKLSSNFDKLRSRLKNNEIIFMVKANAYGHGIFDITKYTYENCDIKNFGVASLREAVLIRERVPFLKADIFVFSDTELTDKDKAKFYLEYNLKPVISNLSDLERICSDNDFKNLPIILKFNTGMNRLGIAMEDLDKTIDILKKYNRSSVNHLMSHYSSSYLKLSEGCMAYTQKENFEKVKTFFKDSGIDFECSSMANSGAIEKELSLEETHVRPGIMIYGPQSSMTGNSVWDGDIISKLYTKVVHKFNVKPGDSLGYGNHVVSEAGTVFVLGVGYGDGIHTSYSGKTVYLNEHQGKIIGRVNMDLTFVFMKDDPGVKVDQIVYLWDYEQKSIARLEKSLNTISYELFCALSVRIPRRYSLN